MKSPTIWDHDMLDGEIGAFKFRGVNHFERDLELIREDKLYCSTLDDFNDAIEREFVYSCPAEQADEARRWPRGRLLRIGE